MDTVSFVAMHDGTRADYEILARLETQYNQCLPDRILGALGRLENSLAGYKVSRLEHSLQSATRAHRDRRDDEYVVAALVHDIGDELAPHTHGAMTAAIMSPFFSEKLCWIVQHHPVFQQRYYGHHTGDDPNARDRYRDHDWFAECVDFCERYDENCFDPAYASLPLEFFEPMVRRIFSEPRYLNRS